MPFQLQTNQTLNIDGVLYSVAEHPAAPGMPYGQEGRQATVYQLAAGSQKRALKVFKARYQVPSLAGLSDRLAPLASLPSLQVCQRTVLTASRHKDLLRQYPDLTYAMLMPWVEGPTWIEVLLGGSTLTPERSLGLARALAEDLAAMEERGVAHCDLSGPNVLLPALASPDGRWGLGELRPDGERIQSALGTPHSAIELVDVESIHGPGLERPNALPGGSPGYAHKTAPGGLWRQDADRFAGAVLLAEMLGWCDERVRSVAWGESYFDPDEMQQDCARYYTFVRALRERWGTNVGELFQRAWKSETFAECPTFGEWVVRLPEQVSTSEAADQSDEGRAVAEAPQWADEETEAARALMALARSLEKKGSLEKALAYYRDALAIAPRDSGITQDLALILRDLEARASPQDAPPKPTSPTLSPTPVPLAPGARPMYSTPVAEPVREADSLSTDGPTTTQRARYEGSSQYGATSVTPAKPQGRWGWLVGSLILLAVAIASSWGLGTVAGTLEATAQATATAEAQATAVTFAAESTATANAKASATAETEATATSVAVRSTSTAQARAQATIQANSTATARAEATIAVHAQAHATAQALDQRATLVYGPTTGALEHPEDDFVSCHVSGIELRNLIVEVRFYNPYSTSLRGWDYGIFFRDTGSARQYRLFLDANGYYYFGLHDGDNYQPINSGKVEGFDLSDTGSNVLKVHVMDDKAYFFVNNNYVRTLDVSEKNQTGYVRACTCIARGNEVSGKSTRFQGFTLWSLENH